MPSACPAASPRRADYAPYNVTEVLLTRYRDSPKDDWDRLFECWGYQDCGDCHRSKGFCGWCPISSTCLPLPNDSLSRALPLLAPLRYKFICAEGPERFELRTTGLGCQVSTITLLTSIVTIFSTVLGILVLYLSLKCVKCIGLSTRARKGGYVVRPNEHDRWKGGVWVRKSGACKKWWRGIRGAQKEVEVEEVDGGATGNTGRMWWGSGVTRENGFMGAERRPLLDDNQESELRQSE